MNRIAIIFFAVFIFSCKSKPVKPKVPAAEFFPVTSYLKGQVAMLDTSFYSFYKVETINGKIDTLSIRNKDVKLYAKDFTDLPDIGTSSIKDDYVIDNLYDDMLECFVFTFSTKQNYPVKREDVVLEPQPNEQNKNDIKSIFVQVEQQDKDTIVNKNLFWVANSNFKIITTKKLGDQPPQTKTVTIFWNGF